MLNFSRRRCSNQLQFCAPSPLLLWCLQAPVHSCDALFMLAIAPVCTFSMVLHKGLCSQTSCSWMCNVVLTHPSVVALHWCLSHGQWSSQLHGTHLTCVSHQVGVFHSWISMTKHEEAASVTNVWRKFCDKKCACSKQRKKASKEARKRIRFCFVLGFVERGFACP